MPEQLMSFPWGAAEPARSYSVKTPVFQLRSPTFSRERSYDRTMLRFTAPGERLLADASYEINNVYAILLDDRGQIINRRGHESNRQTLIGASCTWGHEFYDEQLARAASILYEVETRIDYRRILLSSRMSPVDFDSDTRQPWLLENSFIDDRLMQMSVGTFYSRGDLEISAMATSTCLHDGHRSELELAFFDEAGNLLASRWMSMSIGTPGVGYNDTSLRLEKEKRIARAIHRMEVRGRSEVRTIGRVGPISLEDGEAKKPSAN